MIVWLKSAGFSPVPAMAHPGMIRISEFLISSFIILPYLCSGGSKEP